MSVGLDFGTSILCLAEKDDKDKTVVRSERNCFISLDTGFEDMLVNSGYKFIKMTENDEERIFVIGKDAIKLDNLTMTREKDQSDLRRPMAQMVINSKTEKKAISMLKHMSQSLLGPPSHDGEVCCFSCPSNSIDGKVTTTFHANMCKSFVEELGYTAIPINEALAVVFATNPTIEDKEEGTIPMTGIGISFGGGGSNGCVAYKGKDTITLSVARGGDWIDQQVANVTSKTSSQVTVLKERASRAGTLDLSQPVDGENEVIDALKIFYRSLIETVIKEFKKEFIANKVSFDTPLEIVISGGTSLPPGFDTLIDSVVKTIGFPFEIKGVRRADDALSATALGCLTAAISHEKKILKRIEEIAD